MGKQFIAGKGGFDSKGSRKNKMTLFASGKTPRITEGND